MDEKRVALLLCQASEEYARGLMLTPSHKLSVALKKQFFERVRPKTLKAWTRFPDGYRVIGKVFTLSQGLFEAIVASIADLSLEEVEAAWKQASDSTRWSTLS